MRPSPKEPLCRLPSSPVSRLMQLRTTSYCSMRLPVSLGIKLKGGLMDVITPRSFTIPKKVTKTYNAVVDGETIISSDVLQGDRAMAQDNH
jgi:molecular chaperone DnaK (HSP70)